MENIKIGDKQESKMESEPKLTKEQADILARYTH